MSDIESQIEELEQTYDHYQRAADTNKSGSDIWQSVADEKLEELIELREEQVEELARQHNGIKGVDHIAVGQQNDIRKEYRYAVSELSALREKAGEGE